MLENQSVLQFVILMWHRPVMISSICLPAASLQVGSYLGLCLSNILWILYSTNLVIFCDSIDLLKMDCSSCNTENILLTLFSRMSRQRFKCQKELLMTVTEDKHFLVNELIVGFFFTTFPSRFWCDCLPRVLALLS